MSHGPIDIAVNPNNSAQRYVLHTNGRIDNYGGAPVIVGPAWYDRLDTVAMALHITNWTTGQGYVLDWQGGFTPLGGAPNLMTDTVQYPLGSVPGVPYQLFRCYIDWSWDPAGTGQGYVVDEWGQLYAFGGAPAPTRTGPRFNQAIVRRIFMRWTPDRRAVLMDMHGGLYAEFSQPALPTNLGNGYWPKVDAARDVFVTDWLASTIVGYTLDMHGVLWPFGGAPTGGAPGGIYSDGDVARAFHVLSVSNPTRLWQVWANAQTWEYVFSSPPTLVAGGASSSPATTTTTTTRPTLAWSYSDPQRDQQAAFEVYLFTQAYVTANPSVATNPALHAASAVYVETGNNPNTRGVVPNVDLTNIAYRFYARAQDTSGQWSAWATRGWTQNVPVPNTPTSLSAVPSTDPAKWQVALSVATVSSVATHVRFECSDDGGTTWAAVRGAEAVPRLSTTLATDVDLPPQKMRGYRAIAFAEAPRTASLPSSSVFTQGGRQVYVLTSTSNPALGGEIMVVEAPSFTRDAKAGVFEGIGAEFYTVISDGVPKARRQTITVETNSAAEWTALAKLIYSDTTLVFRDPFGEVVYCRVVGSITRTQQRKPRNPGETTPLRHNHLVQIPLVQVAQPAPGTL